MSPFEKITSVFPDGEKIGVMYDPKFRNSVDIT